MEWNIKPPSSKPAFLPLYIKHLKFELIESRVYKTSLFAYDGRKVHISIILGTQPMRVSYI